MLGAPLGFTNMILERVCIEILEEWTKGVGEFERFDGDRNGTIDANELREVGLRPLLPSLCCLPP